MDTEIMPKFFGFVVSLTQVNYMKKELHSFFMFPVIP